MTFKWGYLDRFQRNQRENQLIELSLKSLVWVWVDFPLPTILIFYNNTISTPRGGSLDPMVHWHTPARTAKLIYGRWGVQTSAEPEDYYRSTVGLARIERDKGYAGTYPCPLQRGNPANSSNLPIKLAVSKRFF